jgi:hypothetical protein
VSALALPAVGGTGRETSLHLLVSFPFPIPSRDTRARTYVALAADHLLAVVLGGESLERRLNDTTTQTEDKVKSRLL